MGRRRKRIRLLIYDASQRGAAEQFLSLFWALWGVIGGFRYVVAVHSPEDIPAAVRRVVPRGTRIDQWEFAGHGRSAAPLVDGKRVTAQIFADALQSFVHRATTGWLRCCDAFQGPRGQAFAVELAGLLGHTVFGHTRIVSQQRAGRTYGKGWLQRLRAQADLALAIAGGVLFQSGGCGLRPNEVPHWDPEDEGYSGPNQPNTALLTQRTPPAEWLQ